MLVWVLGPGGAAMAASSGTGARSRGTASPPRLGSARDLFRHMDYSLTQTARAARVCPVTGKRHLCHDPLAKPSRLVTNQPIQGAATLPCATFDPSPACRFHTRARPQCCPACPPHRPESRADRRAKQSERALARAADPSFSLRETPGCALIFWTAHRLPASMQHRRPSLGPMRAAVRRVLC